MPWMEEFDRLQSVAGLKRVTHNLVAKQQKGTHRPSLLLASYSHSVTQ